MIDDQDRGGEGGGGILNIHWWGVHIKKMGLRQGCKKSKKKIK